MIIIIEKEKNILVKYIDTYYFREKIFNILSIGIVMLFIFKGLDLIFSPAQITAIVLVRIFIMKREGKVQSVLLLLILYLGYILEHQYIIIQYFEYMMLGFFFIFLVYYIFKSSSSIKKLKELLLATLWITILISINIHITNTRPVKDPQLQKIINDKYQFQFRTKGKLQKGDPDLDRIMDLDIRSKFSIKTMEGIENFPNLRKISIDRQSKLTDYSHLSYLNNLKDIVIYEPYTDFSINDLPKLENLEFLVIYLGSNQLKDEVIEITRFSNLKMLTLIGLGNQKAITIDIKEVPNLESMELGVNVEKIIGLEEAKNLKYISLYDSLNDYINEIKRLRPDIELK